MLNEPGSATCQEQSFYRTTYNHQIILLLDFRQYLQRPVFATGRCLNGRAKSAPGLLCFVSKHMAAWRTKTGFPLMQI